MSSAICFNLDESKILSSGHGLMFVYDIGAVCGLIMLHGLVSLNPLPNDKFYTLPNCKSLQTTVSN